MLVFTIASLSVLSILYAIFVIYQGIYAYANPDPAHCYYIDGLDTPSLTRDGAETLAKERGIAIRQGYPVDMAHLFRTWFMWGFWGSITQLAILAIFIPLYCLKKGSQEVQKYVFYVMQGLSCCVASLWFVFGFFWRFSRGGRVASGEKLVRPAGYSAT